LNCWAPASVCNPLVYRRARWHKPFEGGVEMSGLIISVRTSAEAEVAIAGGATLLDVKEPRAGSLGRASDQTIESVLECAAGRLPVSAAMGELLLTPQMPPLLASRHQAGRVRGLAYVKWGLSGCRVKDWRKAMKTIRREVEQQQFSYKPVVVAYADWERADSPRPSLACNFACDQQFAALLIDTWGKDGTTLLDWIFPDELSGIAAQCRSAGVKLALAGSLGLKEISELCVLQPDWFAVRGAVCRQGERGGTIDRLAVRRIAEAATGILTSVQLEN
jgi:(5-formylfuran-3-yl)methyl phosphate synthase